jgi:hypothetical protein
MIFFFFMRKIWHLHFRVHRLRLIHFLSPVHFRHKTMPWWENGFLLSRVRESLLFFYNLSIYIYICLLFFFFLFYLFIFTCSTVCHLYLPIQNFKTLTSKLPPFLFYPCFYTSAWRQVRHVILINKKILIYVFSFSRISLLC